MEVRVVERQSDVPFVMVYSAGLLVPNLPCFLGFAGFEPTEQKLVITRFGSENVTKTLVFQVSNMGTVGGQRVLDNDRLQVRMFPGEDRFTQPLCSIAFAVVFVSAVFFQDRFGASGRTLCARGGSSPPRASGGSMSSFLRVVLDATALAPDLVRRVAAGAVDSNQVMSLEHGPVLKNISALQEGKII